MPTTETLPNYAPVIRAQIQCEVAQVQTRIESGSSVRVTRVDIGYVTNAHRGMALFKDGDLISGVPVRIDRFDPNRLSVRTTGEEDVKLR